MTTLEKQMQEREEKYLQSVENILKQSSSARTKIALIYQQHIKCVLAMEDMIADAHFDPVPSG